MNVAAPASERPVPEQIRCLELQHFNLCTRDFEASVEHFQQLFGAQFVHDMPAPHWHAALLYMGGVLFELFVPEHWLLNGRYGAHWVGLEYQVDDVAETRQKLDQRGIGLVRDIGIAMHTDSEPCFGVAFEFYGRSFFSDSPIVWREALKPRGYWADEHPIGFTGLARHSVAVANHTAAVDFYVSVFGARVLYGSERPHVGARVTGVELADSVVEVLSPIGPGVIADHLHRFGDGIRSVVFAVRDLDQTAHHFAAQGITLARGDHQDSLAIRPDDNRGVMMEFTGSEGRFPAAP